MAKKLNDENRTLLEQGKVQKQIRAIINIKDVWLFQEVRETI